MTDHFQFENEYMCSFENRIASRGFRKIAGIDEVGRGALAGPVVAACVMLNPRDIPPGINDSKKINDKKRRALFNRIQDTALSIGVGLIESGIIDEVNIYNATKLAMKAALREMHLTPDFLLIDAVKLYDISISALSITKGDAKSVSIAAASIVAKVWRDDIMIQHANAYPEYGFSAHKGYGTFAHKKALNQYGPTKLHRISFNQVRKAQESWKFEKQP
jgi:ribonuclease HII